MGKQNWKYPLRASSINKLFRLEKRTPYEFLPQTGEIIWGDISYIASLFGFKTQLGVPTTQEAFYKTLVYPKVRESALDALKEKGDRFQISYPVRTQQGKTLWIEECAELCSIRNSKPHRIIGYLQGSGQKKQETLISHHTLRDRMTGLLTKEYFIEHLDNLCKQSQRYGEEAICFVIMVCNLADIQQRKGPDEANAILSQLARQLRKLLRDVDILARVDNNAFGLTLIQCQEKEAKQIIQRIEGLKKTLAYKAGKLTLEVQIALGSAVLNQKSKSGTHVLAEAQSMTLKNEKHFFHQGNGSAQAKLASQKPLEPKSIVQALHENRITLSYQPVVNAKSRVVHYYECLMRLYGEDGHLVLPNRFIPTAEQSDLITLLDLECLSLASKTLRKVPDVKLSINVSGGTVANHASCLRYLQFLRKNADIANRLILELTETVAIQDKERAANFSFQARRLGCRFSIDDFGAGFTSFRNLLALEVDQIKIDGSFIEGISTSRQNQSFVRMVIDLAHTFSLETVAEWINCEADAVLLTTLGINKLQGYYLGIPQLSPPWLESPSPLSQDKLLKSNLP